jgi:hypothetical protein
VKLLCIHWAIYLDCRSTGRPTSLSVRLSCIIFGAAPRDIAEEKENKSAPKKNNSTECRCKQCRCLSVCLSFSKMHGEIHGRTHRGGKMVVIPTILSGGEIIHPSYIGPRVRHKRICSMSPSTRLRWIRQRSRFRIHMVPSIFNHNAIIFVARMMRIWMRRLRRSLWIWM